MIAPGLLDPVIDASFKGFPHDAAPVRRSEIARRGWNVLRGDLPLPVALIKLDALQHNLQWMQRFVRERGLQLAPHGKTSMSPQLFSRQIAAGAWGMTVANVAQARTAIGAGAGRCLIANQVFQAVDLLALSVISRDRPALRLVFLLDSAAQLGLIEDWWRAHGERPFEVLIEVGVPAGRAGCRSAQAALALAALAHASSAVRLVGVECYEGLGATGSSDADTLYAKSLMRQVIDLAHACDERDYFDGQEVLISAGGSAVFDLVAGDLRPALKRRVTGILRPGCYLTHDQGHYRRMVSVVAQRLGCGATLYAAMEVWTAVQSLPEPDLAILTAGKRDISYDMDLPIALARCARGTRTVVPAPADWKVTALNDQHAYLRWANAAQPPLEVGDLIGLGLSHPCTTFDKWRWMPLVDDAYNVVDAIVTCF